MPFLSVGFNSRRERSGNESKFMSSSMGSSSAILVDPRSSSNSDDGETHSNCFFCIYFLVLFLKISFLKYFQIRTSPVPTLTTSSTISSSSRRLRLGMHGVIYFDNSADCMEFTWIIWKLFKASSATVFISGLFFRRRRSQRLQMLQDKVVVGGGGADGAGAGEPSTSRGNKD